MNYFRDVEGMPISLISERTAFTPSGNVLKQKHEIEDRKTGTTTVGIIAKDCIILAADQRATMGHIAEKDVRKVYKITDNVALTIAGALGDSLAMIRFLKAQANLYEIERGTKMTPRAAASLLSNVLSNNRYYPYIFQPIVGGVSTKPELFELSPFGDISEKDDYAMTGSGTTFAMTTFDKEYTRNLSETDAIALAVRAVRAATNRDIYSGGDSVTVAIIYKHGYREADKGDIEKIVKATKFN